MCCAEETVCTAAGASSILCLRLWLLAWGCRFQGSKYLYWRARLRRNSGSPGFRMEGLCMAHQGVRSGEDGRVSIAGASNAILAAEGHCRDYLQGPRVPSFLLELLGQQRALSSEVSCMSPSARTRCGTLLAISQATQGFVQVTGSQSLTLLKGPALPRTSFSAPCDQRRVWRQPYSTGFFQPSGSGS